MSPFAIIALVLILARAIAELWLSRLNQRHVRVHADEVPPAFREMVDETMYRRSVNYTLAKNRFGDVVTLFDAVLLMGLLFSGVLPWAFGSFSAAFGTSVLAMAGFLFATGVASSIVSLPFAWYAQFKLEDRFGFNTTTVKTWVLDRLKGFLLAALLGFPLLALVLKLIEWTGPIWWIWAASVVIAFQLLLLLIAPAVIMPLFNKFAPLPEGSTLRERLFALARRTDFPTRGIEVMDGSKRSHHSNAFFTGFGRFRKIVLFDTLIAQLAEPELESVLAHEIGHYKKRHVVKLLGVSIFGVFMGSPRSPGWRVSSGFVLRSVSSITTVLRQRTLCRRYCCLHCWRGRSVFGFRRWFTRGRAVSSTRRMPSRARPWERRNRLFKHCAN
jgi:STE24 endopeptidase